MQTFRASFVIFFISQIIFSQNDVDHSSYKMDSKMENILSFDDGNFLLMEKTKKGNKFSWFDQDLQPIQVTEVNEKIKTENLYYFSHTGKNIIEKTKKDNYYLINKNRTFLSDGNLDGDISDRFYYRSGTLVDVVSLEFLTDNFYISISRKEGKENYHNGEYSKIEIFLYRKNLETGESRYFPLELPEKTYFNSRWPKLLYYNSSFFIVTSIRETGDSKRIYVNSKYDFQGRILSTNQYEISTLEPENEFAIMNYGPGSFASTPSKKSGSITQNNIINYEFPTSLAKGYIKYDPFDKSYYLYAAVKPKKQNSGMLIYKYDDLGNLKWKKYHALPDTKLKYLNSFNRHIRLEVSKEFIGFNIYSTKGKDYCDFYVLDKSNGELKNNKQFRSYDIQKNGKRYNNLFSQFNLKEKGLKNLIVDSKIMYAALYYPGIMQHLNTINGSGKTAIKSSYINDGVTIVKSKRNSSEISFEKIVFLK